MRVVDRIVVALLLLVILGTASGCSHREPGAGGTRGAMPTVAEAQREALAFLRASLRHGGVPSVEKPVPVPAPCRSHRRAGVTFTYSAELTEPPDAEALAARLAEYWRTRGLDVVPSATEFPRTGTLHSATARAEGVPWGSYEINRTNGGVSVQSRCAAGRIQDHEE